MHPAFSVIFLTTLIGVGQGLFLALYTGEAYSAFYLLPPQDARLFYGLGSALALLFLLTGLAASFFHLGRPERAWRAAARWRTSWLSREVVLLPALMGLVLLYGSTHYSGWNPTLVTVGGTLSVRLTLVEGLLATLTAFALFLVTAMIYATIRFLQEWATPLTVVNYTLLGGASGFTLATAFAFYAAPDLVRFYGIWAIILTLTALITRTAALIRNGHLKANSSLQTAIGVRHTRIAQKAQGAMGGSFNTREFFHGRPPGFLRVMRWLFLALTFAVPVILLTRALAAPSAAVLLGAFAAQYVGLLAERWYFFAQANHPQNLYYQTL